MAIYEPIADAGGGRRRIRVKSPVSLEPIGEFEVATRGDALAAVERARKAQREWARLPVAERAKPMWRFLSLYIERQDEIIDAVIQETGKPRSEAISMEVYSACDAIAWYAKHAARILRPRKRRIHGVMGFAKKLRIVYQPLGVVGLITPWNGPVVLAVNPMVQALLAGNAVVHKPSEVTPFSALVVKRIFDDAGFPPDLYQVL